MILISLKRTLEYSLLGSRGWFEEQQTEFQKEGSSVEQNEVSILELRQQKARTKLRQGALYWYL